ncbi:hypothetical protein WA556_004797, partial [Blastocystis sp. ATCC 50177/Nand II]
MDTLHSWLWKQSTIWLSVFSILFLFLFFIVHSQNTTISQLKKQVRDSEVIVNKLTEALSNSSLDQLFRQVYDSAINDMTFQVDSLVSRVDSERASIVSDYSMVKRDYESMQKQIAAQTEMIQQLRRENANLTAYVDRYRAEVEKYRNRVLYDGTDLIDYAYEKNGGRVLTGKKWTSPPPHSAYFSNTEQADPAIAISPPTEKGFCYPMGSLEPLFAVKTASPRNPRLFSIDHISRFVTEDRSSAPKRMEIWGFESENSDPQLLVRDCRYDIEGEQTQFCTSSYTGSGFFSIFQLHVLENWGASFTCLYRFRV